MSETYNKDCLVRAVSADGYVKAAAVSTRALTERARQIHKTLPVATAALGGLHDGKRHERGRRKRHITV